MERFLDRPGDGPLAGSPSADGHQPFDEHNLWLRSLREEYNQRVSRACESAPASKRLSGASRISDHDEVDMARADQDLASIGLAERMADFDLEEFEEEPIYRSLAMPSGGGLTEKQLDEPLPIYRSLDMPIDTVDAQWLNSNPPLIRRQKAFADREV
mmetsp:Transcript_76482/g.127446  ORF Transcript_76482/g.127446 Transcript_76482/m.127446 type:complete len:157 (+) Transcript_76482:81-551(+)